MFIQKKLNINLGFNIKNTSIVNLLASFFLGILVALNFVNHKIFLLLYIGFLGCFSTFSSFIYQLFVLFKKKEIFDFSFSLFRGDNTCIYMLLFWLLFCANY